MTTLHTALAISGPTTRDAIARAFVLELRPWSSPLHCGRSTFATGTIEAGLNEIERANPANPGHLAAAVNAGPALAALESVWKADARFRSSVLQTIATGLDAWQEPVIAAATVGDSQISAERLLAGPNTLYLIAPAHDQRRLRGLFTALVAEITAAAFERSAHAAASRQRPCRRSCRPAWRRAIRSARATRVRSVA